PTAGAVFKAFNAAAVIRFGSLMFSTGLRLAMPVIGSLLLLDLAFALLSKVHSQMQLLHLSFAAKMLAGLVLLSILVAACPALLKSSAARTFEILFRLLT
ncbi:MAG: flagellar biosynthetic protein FliR, partial [Bryobacteraceae bacterium]